MRYIIFSKPDKESPNLSITFSEHILSRHYTTYHTYLIGCLNWRTFDQKGSYYFFSIFIDLSSVSFITPQFILPSILHNFSASLSLKTPS